MLVFAVDDRASLERIESKWVPEVTQHIPRAALMLVGTKSDLLGGNDCVTFQEGMNVLGRINAYQHKMISAAFDAEIAEIRGDEGDVAAVFRMAAEAASGVRDLSPKRQVGKKKNCNIS